jgi:hypothetical protein
MPIRIERFKLVATIGADSDWHPLAMCSTAYLSTTSGAIVLAQSGYLAPSVGVEYGQDLLDEMFGGKEMIDENPEKYLRIPTMSHGDHHAVIRDFLESDWTINTELKDRIRDVDYPRKSIDAWLKEVRASAAEKYFEYRSAATEACAEKFFRENGVEFKWE